MKQFLRDYFTFNRRERNGVFILLSIIILLLLYLSFSDFFFPKEKIDFSKFEKEIADFETEQKRVNDSLSQQKNYFASSNAPDPDSYRDAERFSFNPNNLPDEEWKRLGLSEKQIRTIKNYESKGGKFRSKEDVKKMYSITPELYALLEKYILIPENNKTIYPANKHQPSPDSYRDINHQPLLVELNSADTTELKTLKGIGSSFAKRIVKFRDMLGGFVKKEQLLEVYGFDKEKYDLVSPQVKIDLSKVKRININSASVDNLRKHPYMDKKAAVKIFWHRVNHGDYADVEDILKTNLVDEQLYSKLAPYLTVK